MLILKQVFRDGLSSLDSVRAQLDRTHFLERYDLPDARLERPPVWTRTADAPHRRLTPNLLETTVVVNK
jgi:hypothetical protein